MSDQKKSKRISVLLTRDAYKRLQDYAATRDRHTTNLASDLLCDAILGLPELEEASPIARAEWGGDA